MMYLSCIIQKTTPINQYLSFKFSLSIKALINVYHSLDLKFSPGLVVGVSKGNWPNRRRKASR